MLFRINIYCSVVLFFTEKYIVTIVRGKLKKLLPTQKFLSTNVEKKENGFILNKHQTRLWCALQAKSTNEIAKRERNLTLLNSQAYIIH